MAPSTSIAAAIPGSEMDMRTRGLLEAPLLRTIARMAVPHSAVMATQVALGLIELYFLAKLGVDTLAGVSQVFPLISLTGAISQGAIGGGVLSAIARQLGKSERSQADETIWYAIAIAVAMGALTSAAILGGGPAYYAAMGARGASLDAAITYSNLVFAFAIMIWLFNLLLGVVRGTGNLILPLVVVCGGAAVAAAAMPILIFGWGAVPAFGLIGGALAMIGYYTAGSVCLLLFLFGHRGVLRPRAAPPRFRFERFREILRVGGMAALVSLTTNVTLAAMTGFVATHGTAAVAGYGAGARLEFLLTSVSYCIGAPATIIIGTNIGAGDRGRALRASWIAVFGAAFLCELVGICGALWPEAWLGLFTTDPDALAVGSQYLRTVGPFFGFFGVGYAMYCVGQGMAAMGWPVADALLRTMIAVAGGAFAGTYFGEPVWIFAAASAGMLAFALVSMADLAPHRVQTNTPR
jgi:Na+-driven multidrug efflux pump